MKGLIGKIRGQNLQILFLLFLAVAVAETRQVGGGIFVIEENGKKRGTETFTCIKNKDWRLVGESVHLGSNRDILRYTYRFDRNFHPIHYRVEERKGDSPISIEVDFRGKELAVKKKGDGGVEKFNVVKRKDVVVLDHNVFGHFYVLYKKLKKREFRDRKLVIFVPRFSQYSEALVRRGRKITLKSGKRTLRATLIELDFDVFTIELFEKNGKLIGGRIPSAGIFFYRRDLYKEGLKLKSSEEFAEEEVFIYTRGGRIAGVLTIPKKGKPPYPAVLLVTGSGPLDRDGNAENFRTNFFRDIAHYLAKRGIVSLRYDKRGVGKSSGNFESVSMRDLVDDGIKVLKYLKSRKKLVDRRRIFVLGHSEGGVIASQIVLKERVGGLILVASPYRSLDSLILWQIKKTAETKGVPPEVVESDIKRNEKFFEFIRTSRGEWSDYKPREVSGFRKTFSLRWWREHLSLSPSEVYRKIRCPVLILHGKLDPQVPYEDAGRIGRVIKKSEVHIFEHLNHYMKYEKGFVSPGEQNFSGPLDGEFLSTLKNWIKSR